MSRGVPRLAGLLALIGLLIAGPISSALGPDDEPQIIYVVHIAATDPTERSLLLRQGLVIDHIDAEGVVVTIDARELEDLRRRGFEILDAQPLQFPIQDEGYHNYQEMVAEIRQAEQDHPEIVQLSTIGLSIEGRDIHAVKISDNVSMDEAEPEVLLFALTHAREHLTTEQALDLVSYFSDNYGLSGEITNLVNEREIWILPNVNPDGDEFDRKDDGTYRNWRKNRRDNGDGSWGIDLNRNYGYQWGNDNVGSSPLPGSATYRGTAPFSEPETSVIRDFALSRPDLTVSISFHTYGESILWPYGYTGQDVPANMDPLDHATLVRLAQDMAGMNGYVAKQAYDLYPTNGDSDDWLYGERGIFALTFEMYPAGPYPGFYPPDSIIPAETARNRGAVSYLVAVADSPRKIVGQEGDVTQPSVVLVSPAEGDAVRGEVELRAAATDDVGVTLIEFLANGSTIGLDSSAPYTITWNTSGILGAQVLTAKAYDHGHNPGTSLEVSVTVLPAPPTPTATATATLTPTRNPLATATVTPSATASPLLPAAVFMPQVFAWEG